MNIIYQKKVLNNKIPSLYEWLPIQHGISSRLCWCRNCRSCCLVVPVQWGWPIRHFPPAGQYLSLFDPITQWTLHYTTTPLHKHTSLRDLSLSECENHFSIVPVSHTSCSAARTMRTLLGSTARCLRLLLQWPWLCLCWSPSRCATRWTGLTQQLMKNRWQSTQWWNVTKCIRLSTVFEVEYLHLLPLYTFTPLLFSSNCTALFVII